MKKVERRNSWKALTIVELLVVVATIGILSTILFPVIKQASKKEDTRNVANLRKIALAAIQYGDDYDERIPIIANGAFRNMKSTKDGVLTAYGDQRTDLWPLLMLPYVKDRATYTDPSRADSHGIFASPALATQDPGYTPTGPSYRNQNRFPFFGMNYIFLSPLHIPASKMSDPTPTDFMEGEVRRFFQAADPDKTVFFTPAARNRVPSAIDDNRGIPDNDRGHFGVNAPGMWTLLASGQSGYSIQWAGTNCSGDWCGADIDPTLPGVQTSQSFFYQDPITEGNNVAFLDGHISFKKSVDLAAGTDYLSATARDGGTGAFGGGAVITDKSKYLWNLDDFYYGA